LLPQIFTKDVLTGNNVFIAPNATVIGKVTLGDDVSVWFGAVIRADGDAVSVGNRTNIQDNAVVHVDPGSPVSIGHDCIIGHLALVHGATLGNYVLFGMQSTIMNGAVIGDNCIIGAGSLITAGTIIPPNSLVMGAPAKVIRPLKETEFEAIRKNANSYVNLKNEYLRNLNAQD